MRRRLIRIVLLGVVPAIGLVIGAYYYVAAGRYVTTENAYLKAHVVSVSAEVAGRVTHVLVGDNAPVAAGDQLFRIDPEPYRLAYRKAEAVLSQVRNNIAALRAANAQGEMELKEARANIRYFRRVFARQQTLARKGIASRAKYEEAERNLAISRQRAEALKQKILSLLARLGGRTDIATEDLPDYIESKASRDNARLDLKRATVFAPSSGVIGRVTLRPGEYVRPGQAVFPLVQTGGHWIEANLKETQLTHLRIGQKATVVLDAYPGRVLTATVRSISPSTGSEFAILPPQNASGNWVKVVQRVPVRLAVDASPAGVLLRAGMTASVSIDTGREVSLFDVIGSALAWTTGSK